MFKMFGVGGTIFLTVILAIFIFDGFGGSGGMVDKQLIIKAVENHGFTDPVIIAESRRFVGWQGCDGSDRALFKVSATNAQGNKVPLLVCAGWPFKGATIRAWME